MNNAKATITMPHRHSVRYEQGDLIVDYDTEPTVDAIIFYPASSKIVSGILDDPNEVCFQILNWLHQKFEKVDVDLSPKPIFR